MTNKQPSAAQKVADFKSAIAANAAAIAEISAKLPALLVDDCRGDKKAEVEYDRLALLKQKLESKATTFPELLNQAIIELESETALTKRTERVKSNGVKLTAMRASGTAISGIHSKTAAKLTSDWNNLLVTLKKAGVNLDLSIDIEHVQQALERRANELKHAADTDAETLEQRAESDAWSHASHIADTLLGHRALAMPHLAHHMFLLPINKKIGDNFSDMDLLNAIKFESDDDRDRVAYLLIQENATFNHREVEAEPDFAKLGARVAAVA